MSRAVTRSEWSVMRLGTFLRDGDERPLYCEPLARGWSRTVTTPENVCLSSSSAVCSQSELRVWLEDGNIQWWVIRPRNAGLWWWMMRPLWVQQSGHSSRPCPTVSLCQLSDRWITSIDFRSHHLVTIDTARVGTDFFVTVNFHSSELTIETFLG